MTRARRHYLAMRRSQVSGAAVKRIQGRGCHCSCRLAWAANIPHGKHKCRLNSIVSVGLGVFSNPECAVFSHCMRCVPSELRVQFKIAAWFRRHRALNAYTRLRRSAIVLQAHARRRRHRGVFVRQRRAVVTLQCWSRMVAARASLHKAKGAATAIRAEVLRHAAVKRFQRYRGVCLGAACQCRLAGKGGGW